MQVVARRVLLLLLAAIAIPAPTSAADPNTRLFQVYDTDQSPSPLCPSHDPSSILFYVKGSASHYRIYFSQEPGALGTLVASPADASCFSASGLASGTLYYATLRSYNPITGYEEPSTDQRIVPIFWPARWTDSMGIKRRITAFAQGPAGAIYARSSDGGIPVLIKSTDWGASWRNLCPLPWPSLPDTYGGFTVDSKGYLYFPDSNLDPATGGLKVSRDDCATLEPMLYGPGAPAGLPNTRIFLNEPSTGLHQNNFWITAWNVSEILPGQHPSYPNGVLFLSTYSQSGLTDLPEPPGCTIIYSTDPYRSHWNVYQVPSGMCPRHIHGFKVNPYNVVQWWLSTGDLLVGPTSLFRTDDMFHTWTATQRKVGDGTYSTTYNGPTGLAFYPDRTLLIADDYPPSMGGRVQVIAADGTQVESFDPTTLNTTLDVPNQFNAEYFMYDAAVLADSKASLVTFQSWQEPNAVLGNLNGYWDVLMKTSEAPAAATGYDSLWGFAHNSQQQVPATSAKVFLQGYGGLQAGIAQSLVRSWPIKSGDRYIAGDAATGSRKDLLAFNGSSLALLGGGAGFSLTGKWRTDGYVGGWMLGPSDGLYRANFGEYGKAVLAANSSYIGLFRPQADGSLALGWAAYSQVQSTACSWTLGASDKYWVGDLDGDGRDEIAVGNGSSLAILKVRSDGGLECVARANNYVGSFALGASNQYVLARGPVRNGIQSKRIVALNPTIAKLGVIELRANSLECTWSEYRSPQQTGWTFSFNDRLHAADLDTYWDGMEEVYITNGMDIGMWHFPVGGATDELTLWWKGAGSVPGGWVLSQEDVFESGDLDGDGKAEIFVRNARTGWIGVIKWNPAAGLTCQWGLGGVVGSSHTSTIGDFDGDGIAEVALVSASTAEIWKYDGGSTSWGTMQVRWSNSSLIIGAR